MDAVQMVRLALSVITDRLLTILALAGVFVLSLWIMQEPELIRLGTEIIFAVFAYLLIRNKENKNERVRQRDGERQE
jgi:hypothetical protein